MVKSRPATPRGWNATVTVQGVGSFSAWGETRDQSERAALKQARDAQCLSKRESYHSR